MTHPEGSDKQHPSDQPVQRIELSITPDQESGIIFKREADNTLVIGGRGEFAIRMNLPNLPTLKEEDAAAELVINAFTAEKDSQIPDSPPPAVTEPHSAGDMPSWERPKSDMTEIPENENNKVVLEGNPAKILGYRVTRKTNTRIADFVMATHPDKATTSYWRVRAYGDEAEKVRDQVEVGQKGVEVTVYGPKYWK